MTTTFAGATLLGTWTPADPEWHAARATRLGGSEIAAVLGLSPWESAFSLWHRKAGLIGEQDENPQMSWGKRLEPVIADAFADEHPDWDVVPAGTYVHPQRDYQVANPDRLIYEGPGGGIPAATVLDADGTWPDPDALLEIKTARDDTGWGEPGTDQVPVPYRCQVLWYLDTLGLRKAYIAVLIAGSDYREYVIDLDTVDDSEIAMLRTEAELFLTTVRTGVRPDIDGHSATYQVVKALPEGVVDADVEIDPKTADDYVGALAAFKRAEAEKRRLTSLVLDHIGDARRATCLGERVATRVVHPDGRTKSLMPARKK